MDYDSFIKRGEIRLAGACAAAFFPAPPTILIFLTGKETS